MSGCPPVYYHEVQLKALNAFAALLCLVGFVLMLFDLRAIVLLAIGLPLFVWTERHLPLPVTNLNADENLLSDVTDYEV
jgi:hypothetical protein